MNTNNTNNDNIQSIQSLFNNIQTAIDNNDNTNAKTLMTQLKSLLDDSTGKNNQQFPVSNYEVNTLDGLEKTEDLSIDEKNIMLDTKLKQIELINKRNDNKKSLLMFLIILNILIAIVFVALLTLKIMK
jgi:subtilase family serine protease